MDSARIADHLTGARAELLAVIEGLDNSEICTGSIAGTWTIWDVLAHISGWAAWDLAAIRMIRGGEHPDLAGIQDVDSFNAKLVAERSGWPVARILAEMRDTQATLLNLLADIPEQDLFSNRAFEGPYWENLAGWLAVAWEHEREHAQELASQLPQIGYRNHDP